MELQRLTRDQIQKGLVVICFKPPATIRVGRVHSDVITNPLLQIFLGEIFVNFDLLYADQSLQAEQLIWKRYFCRNENAPTTSGVFGWPALIPLLLTFERAVSGLEKGYKGKLFHVEVWLG